MVYVECAPTAFGGQLPGVVSVVFVVVFVASSARSSLSECASFHPSASQVLRLSLAIRSQYLRSCCLCRLVMGDSLR
jgi:hypothetical protein